MLQSQLFARTKREISKEIVFASHRLLLRADFIHQFSAGVYALLPLGFKVIRNIEKIIREEFNKIGIQELSMPLLQPAELWEKTGRLKTSGKELWRIKDRKGEELVLAMTHEETIAAIAADTIRSEDALPVIVNQFETKVRDEERPRGGLLRLREFLMQDAYSFDKDEKDLNQNFQKMVKIYKKIFKRMNLPVIPVRASTGVMGGSESYEFMVISEAGEDKVVFCPKCNFAANIEMLREKQKCSQCEEKMEIKKAIEVAHAFKLGTKYSKAMNILYQDKIGKKHFVQMGCYGIGLERTMAAIVEVHHDKKGIIWPVAVAPYRVHLLSIGRGKEVAKKSLELYNKLIKQNIEVLYDDRDESPGVKFADSDLIGIPIRLVVSEKTLVKDSVEVKRRGEKKMKLVKLNKLNRELKFAIPVS